MFVFLSSSRTTLALTAPVVSRCATCTRFPTPVSSCRPRWTVRARRRRSAWVSSSSTTCTGSRRPATPTSCSSQGRPATWPRPRPVTWPRQPSTPAPFTMATAASSPTPYSTAIWVRTAATDRAPHLCFIACPRRPTPRWDTLSGRQAPSSVPPPPRIRPAPCPPPTHRWTWARQWTMPGQAGGPTPWRPPSSGPTRCIPRWCRTSCDRSIKWCIYRGCSPTHPPHNSSQSSGRSVCPSVCRPPPRPHPWVHHSRWEWRPTPCMVVFRNSRRGSQGRTAVWGCCLRCPTFQAPVQWLDLLPYEHHNK